MDHLSPSQKEEFVEKLLRWYERHQRPLPWRNTQDPYRIWVAEVMLQQTQVATVRRYYERFLKEFPTVRALAAAPLDRVLKAWEGLGYYARARHLHRAAQIVVRRFRGAIPADKQKLLRLPGIGRYTAAAILSIAFGRDEVVLDGNVRRVLARAAHLEADPRRSRVERRMERWLKGLLPPGRAGAFNQALMELGATICTPRSPRCLLCPIGRFCEARRLGHQDLLPVRALPRRRPHYEVAVGIIWKEGKVLIAQRPLEGLLGGLWEFPGGKRRPDEPLIECLKREVREELGIEIEVLKPLMTVRHGYTHFRVTLHAFECRWQGGEPQALGCRAWAWVRPHALTRYAFPRANRAILEALSASSRLDPD